MIPAQLGDENKTIQYITQPFSYGQSYALVNHPVQIAGTTQNGQIVINKQISAVSKSIYQVIKQIQLIPITFLEHNFQY